MGADTVILGIIIGTLAAIVYSLRVLILLERRIARMDLNIETLTRRILREELVIEREERLIKKKLGIGRKSAPKRTAKKKPAKRKATKKKVAKRSTRKKPAKRRR